MQRKLDVYLWDIRHAGETILRFTLGKTLADYQQDSMLRAAVERQFTIMGEAMVRVRIHFPSAYERLSDAPKLISFRNQLTHLYDLIDDEEVWRIIEVSLPPLLQQISFMIEEEQR